MSRRTKIVGTIGPTSWDEPVLRRLLEAGVDVVRLNFSHATHEKAAEIIGTVRKINSETGRNVAILQDLQGPRIRTGKVAQKITLSAGQEVTLTTQTGFEATSADLIGVDYEGLPLDVNTGDCLLIEDGLFKLQVLDSTTDQVKCVVIEGGQLGSHKGINVPDVTLSVPTITEKDKVDLKFGLEHQVDYVALSFVRHAEDVEYLRRLIREYSGKDDPVQLPHIIAKIEKHEAITNFDEILKASDGIMVARGDLGVEMNTEDIPILQKKIIRKCNLAGKPVITATQMLDSMIRNPRPTRAETTDVANAIIDGSDAIMLSGETANGAHPLDAVRVMSRIAEYTEREWLFKHFPHDIIGNEANTITEAISEAVFDIARSLEVAAILVSTTSGSTARLISRNRPGTPLLVATAEERTFRRLALIWGVRAIMTEKYTSTTELVRRLESMLLERGLVKHGDTIIITGGVPVGMPGRTNMIRVLRVGEEI
jgi:pyruvate kinase